MEVEFYSLFQYGDEYFSIQVTHNSLTTQGAHDGGSLRSEQPWLILLRSQDHIVAAPRYVLMVSCIAFIACIFSIGYITYPIIIIFLINAQLRSDTTFITTLSSFCKRQLLHHSRTTGFQPDSEPPRPITVVGTSVVLAAGSDRDWGVCRYTPDSCVNLRVPNVHQVGVLVCVICRSSLFYFSLL